MAVAVYLNSLHGELLFDDEPAIIRNPDIRLEAPWVGLLSHDFWGTPISFSNSNKSFRPITVASFRLNFLLHQLRPLGYHAVNVVLHSFVTFLFHGLCFRCFSQIPASVSNDTNIEERSEFSWSAKAHRVVAWRSHVAALLFAIHPVHTEAVSGVVGRAELLSGMFFLLALLPLLDLRSTEVSSFSPSTLTTAFHTALCVCCSAAGMLSKEQGIAALPVAACVDVMRFLLTRKHCSLQQAAGGEDHKRACDGRGRLTVVVVGVRALTLAASFGALAWLRLWVLGPRGASVPFARENNPAAFSPEFSTRCLTFNYVAALHLGKLLWPATSNLCCDWSRGSVPLLTSFRDPRNLATAALWLGAAAGAWRVGSALLLEARRPPRSEARDVGREWGVAVALTLLVVPYLPASNLLVHVGFVVAERVLYIPSMGFCLGLAVALVGRTEAELFDDMLALTPEPLSTEKPLSNRAPAHRPLAPAASSALKHEKVWSNAATATPSGGTGRSSSARGIVGDLPCLCRVATVVSLVAFYSFTTLARNADWRTRERLWASGVAVNPRNAALWYNLGHELEDRAAAMASELHQHQHRKQEPEQEREEAASAQRQVLEQAWACFSKAADLEPSSAGQANTMLGVMAMRAGALDLAKQKFEAAIRTDKPTPTAHHNLAILLLTPPPMPPVRAAEGEGDDGRGGGSGGPQGGSGGGSGDQGRGNPSPAVVADAGPKHDRPLRPLHTDTVTATVAEAEAVAAEVVRLEQAVEQLRLAVALDPTLHQALEVLGGALGELALKTPLLSDLQHKQHHHQQHQQTGRASELPPRYSVSTGQQRPSPAEYRRESLAAFSAAFRVHPSPRSNRALLSKLQALAATLESEGEETSGTSSSTDSGSGSNSNSNSPSLVQCERLSRLWDVERAERCFNKLFLSPDTREPLPAPMLPRPTGSSPVPSSSSSSVAALWGSWGSFLAATGGPSRRREALAALTRAAALSPGEPLYCVAACKVTRELGAAGAAERCFETCAESFPRYAPAQAGLQAVRRELGREP